MSSISVTPPVILSILLCAGVGGCVNATTVSAQDNISDHPARNASEWLYVPSLLQSHTDLANCEFRVAECRRAILQDRAERTSQLMRLGLASWQEHSLASAEFQAALAMTNACEDYLKWLTAAVAPWEALTPPDAPLNSVLICFPDSPVPVGWICQTALHHPPNADGRGHLLTSLATMSETHQFAAANAECRALEIAIRSPGVGTAETSSEAVRLRREHTLACRNVDLIRARQKLQWIEPSLTISTLVSLQQSDSNSRTSQAHHVSTPVDGETQTLLARLNAILRTEAEAQSPAALADFLRIRAESERIAASQLQNEGWVSLLELFHHDRQAEFRKASLLVQRRHQEWLLEWSRKRHAEQPISSEGMTANGLSYQLPLSLREQPSLLNRALEWAHEWFRLQGQRRTWNLHTEVAGERIRRLQGQSLVNETELNQARWFREFCHLQEQIAAERSCVVRELLAQLPELANAVSKGSCLQNIDAATAQFLLKAEASVMQTHPAGQYSESMQLASMRMSALQKLQGEGLASVSEVNSAEQQLLRLQSDREDAEFRRQTSEHRHQLYSLLFCSEPGDLP